MIKRFLKDSAVYGLATILSRGITIFLVPIYARALNPSEYGIIDMITVIANMSLIVFGVEILQALCRLYPEKNETIRPIYVSTALWFTFISLGLFVISNIVFSIFNNGLITGIYFKNGIDSNIFILGMIYIWGYGIYIFTQNQLRWQLMSKQFALTSILYTFFSSVISVFLVVVLKFGLKGVFIGLISGEVIGAIIGWFYAKESYQFKFNIEYLKEMLKYSYPFVFSSVAVSAAMYIDRIAINNMMTLNDVGLFGIAYRFALTISLITAGFQSALAPLIYKYYDKPETKTELVRIMNYFLFMMLTFIMGLGLFSKGILVIFTRPAYYSAANIIPIIAISILVNNMYMFAPGLGIYKKTKYIAFINIGMALLNILLNYMLIPKFGITGTAFSTLISAIIGYITFQFLSQKFYYLPIAWGKKILAFWVFALALIISSAIFNRYNSGLLIVIVLKIIILIITTSLFLYLLIGFQKFTIILKVIKEIMKSKIDILKS